MAKRSKESSGREGPFKGKTFAFTGTLSHLTRDEAGKVIKASGGKVVDGVAANLNYLVAGRTRSGALSAARKRAQQLNGQGAGIQILDDETQFLALFMPSREEALALVKGGPKGWKRLHELPGPWLTEPKIDLSGADLRSLKVHGKSEYEQLNLARLCLDRADLRGVSLRFVRLDGIKEARFDGADLRGSSIQRCEKCNFDDVRLTNGSLYEEFRDCSARGIDLTGAQLATVPPDVSRRDFTGATLRAASASYIGAREAIFKDADLRGAELDESDCEGADFTGAGLSGARLEKARFTKATLVRARLINADLRMADLRDADLRKADFTGANLADADLRGAQLDGANFAGACLFDAKLAGLDLSRARNLEPHQLKGGSVGPNMRKGERQVFFSPRPRFGGEG